MGTENKITNRSVFITCKKNSDFGIIIKKDSKMRRINVEIRQIISCSYFKLLRLKSDRKPFPPNNKKIMMYIDDL